MYIFDGLRCIISNASQSNDVKSPFFYSFQEFQTIFLTKVVNLET